MKNVEIVSVIKIDDVYDRDGIKYMVCYVSGFSKYYSPKTLPNTAKRFIGSAKYYVDYESASKVERVWKNEI